MVIGVRCWPPNVGEVAIIPRVTLQLTTKP